jgi:large subunit ribosomal protein L30e
MVDVDQVLKSAVKSGRVFYGEKEALSAILLGRAVAVVIADNCPPATRNEIEKQSGFSSIPILNFKGTSRDLGTACRKPFGVSVLAVREIPETDLALAVKESTEKSPSDQIQI